MSRHCAPIPTPAREPPLRSTAPSAQSSALRNPAPAPLKGREQTVSASRPHKLHAACGTDRYSGQSYEHRRGWIVERAKELAGVFAIDVAAYAVMSNHYHLEVRIDAPRAAAWSRDELLRRWTQLFDGPLAVQRLLADKGKKLDAGTRRAIDQWAETYRARLCNLSCFMRVLNESITSVGTDHVFPGRGGLPRTPLHYIPLRRLRFGVNPAAPTGLGDHGLRGAGQQGNAAMAGQERADQQGRIFHIFVHHLVA